jgi:hypothetical protein
MEASFKKLTVVVMAGLLLLAIAALAETPAGSGVTLVNQGNHSLHVYVKYGAEGSCETQPKTSELTIDAGQSQMIDTATKACVCLQVPERNTCETGWQEIKAGAKRIYR